jgi:hypothetical protein
MAHCFFIKEFMLAVTYFREIRRRDFVILSTLKSYLCCRELTDDHNTVDCDMATNNVGHRLLATEQKEASHAAVLAGPACESTAVAVVSVLNSCYCV